jgi:hypothetical protein
MDVAAEWLALIPRSLGPRLKSRPGDPAILTEFFVVFLSLARKMSAYYLKLDHGAQPNEVNDSYYSTLFILSYLKRH